MPLYKYKVTTPEGEVREGSMEAAGLDIAVRSLQKRNLIVVSIKPAEGDKSIFDKSPLSFERVKRRDIVIFSRQIATLFEAKVPILTSFKLLAVETENKALGKVLGLIIEDIEGGARISQALSSHPKVFSHFYVSMVLAGEESGKLEEVFKYLADFLERSYELASKAKHALIYPAFVISAFFGVMILMLVSVIPKLADVIKESGQAVPFYTKIVMVLSDLVRNYGMFVAILLAVAVFAFWRYSRTKAGKEAVARILISIPFLGELYRKIYLSRIADNLKTLISGGVTMVRSLEITADTVDNYVYKQIVLDTVRAVKAGSSISENMSRYKEISPLMIQMIKIGEETGKLDFILDTLSTFYEREVDQSLETLVGLIEPAMIIVLGVGVGILLASVLMPIYNIALAV
ncbi:MAG: hypothetical protein COT67_02565 [Candidatus Tagabacteria bacterium CG09_land_8_20_14_0_10_41_14]|uniref:Type II secretion system protein GspF domain-containing protein n=2 Tax=Candidatus Tagaibacteriota TaxID=1817918 RepID=A0A2H0WKV6_9BACT|nr:MAG: hypothetical protein COT67_02565 [Candidatus Tagabacteria bacterium CG09_land_8_20_14_0_10_41_14]